MDAEDFRKFTIPHQYVVPGVVYEVCVDGRSWVAARLIERYFPNGKNRNVWTIPGGSRLANATPTIQARMSPFEVADAVDAISADAMHH